MPIRKTRPRRAEARESIIRLYREPVLKYFSQTDDQLREICELIYGPLGLYTDTFFNEDVRREGFKRLDALRRLWHEVREDILAAQQEYQPDKQPWGSRFDRKRGARRIEE